jgi:hypothetical protein
VESKKYKMSSVNLMTFWERNYLSLLPLSSSLCEFWLSVDEIFVKIATYLNFAILENESNTDNKMKHGRLGRIFVTFYPKSKGNISEWYWRSLEILSRAKCENDKMKQKKKTMKQAQDNRNGKKIKKDLFKKRI